MLNNEIITHSQHGRVGIAPTNGGITIVCTPTKHGDLAFRWAICKPGEQFKKRLGIEAAKSCPVIPLMLFYGKGCAPLDADKIIMLKKFLQEDLAEHIGCYLVQLRYENMLSDVHNRVRDRIKYMISAWLEIHNVESLLFIDDVSTKCIEPLPVQQQIMLLDAGRRLAEELANEFTSCKSNVWDWTTVLDIDKFVNQFVLQPDDGQYRYMHVRHPECDNQFGGGVTMAYSISYINGPDGAVRIDFQFASCKANEEFCKEEGRHLARNRVTEEPYTVIIQQHHMRPWFERIKGQLMADVIARTPLTRAHFDDRHK